MWLYLRVYTSLTDTVKQLLQHQMDPKITEPIRRVESALQIGVYKFLKCALCNYIYIYIYKFTGFSRWSLIANASPLAGEIK